MAEGEKLTEQLQKKLMTELIESSIEEEAVRFSELAKKVRLEKEFGDQMTKIFDEET